MGVREIAVNDSTSRTADSQFWCETVPLREGFFRSEGGTVKAARLPKGWTGPVSMLGTRGGVTPAPCYFCARPSPGTAVPGLAHLSLRVEHVDQLPQPADGVAVEAKPQSRVLGQFWL